MDRLISINAVYLYDAKRKLKVMPSETYILKGWHNGWKEIGSCKPKDSRAEIGRASCRERV